MGYGISKCADSKGRRLAECGACWLRSAEPESSLLCVTALSPRVDEALKRRPIVHVSWGDQPRTVGKGVYEATVELLFKGDNPLCRWRKLQFVVENGGPRLDSDLVAMAETAV